MKKGLFIWLFFVLLAGLPWAAWSQSGHVPGLVYLRLHQDFPFGLPEGKTGPGSSLPDAQLQALAENFQWQEIRCAFPQALPSLRQVYEIRYSALQPPEALCEALNALPFVEYAEPIPWVRSQYLPNDFDSVDMAYLSWVRAPEAWDYHRGDSAVVIAVVDNAVLISHNDLAANVWTHPGEIPGDGLDNDGNGYVDDLHGWDIADGDADPNPPNRNFRHGTHVAGCAAAVTDNGTGVASMGFSCSLMPVKVASDTGFSDVYPFSTALRGVAYAIASGAHIVNMSFGGTWAPLTGQAVIDAGHAKGVIFVAAAGNTGDTVLQYPASYRHVISVAALNQNQKAPFATFNRQVDVAAPGISLRNAVPSITLGSSYAQMSGSSQAAAVVSGLLGLMLSFNPCLGPDEAEVLLKAGCVSLDSLNPGYAGKLGAGRIDAAATMALLERQAPPQARFELADTVACDSQLQAFFLSSDLSACPESWQWHCSNGQTSTAPDPVFSFDSAGIYEISLVVRNAFGADSATRSLAIRIGMSPQVTAGPDTLVAAGDTVALYARGDAVRYQWSPATGLMPHAAVANPWLLADSSRYYVVTGWGTDGCPATDTVFIEVSRTTGSVQPGAPGESRFLLFPNPVSQTFWLESAFMQGGWMRLQLLGLEGKEIGLLFEGKVEPGPFRKELSLPPGLGKGTYFLEITLSSQISYLPVRVL